MHRGNESRRGRKRSAHFTEPPHLSDDDGDAEMESVETVAASLVQNFPEPAFGSSSQSSFLPADFAAVGFEETGATFLDSVLEVQPTSEAFIFPDKPVTSHEAKFCSDIKLLPSETVIASRDLINIETENFQCELIPTTEQCLKDLEGSEPVLSEVPLLSLTDSPDILSALFPSYENYIREGTRGIGIESSQYVQSTDEHFDGVPEFSYKPAYFPQPEDGPDISPSDSTEPETIECDRIYPGSRLSVHESVMAILTFAQTEKLTGAALGRLLSLIDIHCPEKNNLVKNSTKLFDHLSYLKSEFELSYYCSICWTARESAEDLCDKCLHPKRKVHFFIHFPLAEQLKALYKRPEFIEALKYRQTRVKKNENALEDIIDGDLYQEALKGFLSEANNLSLMWYTDGIQLFESTSFSIWPQFFVILELPPDQRFKPENMLLAGLWGSRDHPHPNIVLRHIANDLLNLRNNGVEVELPGSEKQVIRVCCLCGTCDSPAKAAFMNIKGHAGYYCCPVCFTRGQNTAATDNVTVFPFDKEYDLRSSNEDYTRQVKSSLKKYKNLQARDEACQGIQGPTFLSLMFYFCMFKSVAIDSMHCVYMGVVKQLLHLYFDSKYSKEDFSLSDKLEEINTLLSNIQLPEFVQRLPLSVDKLSFWKASLCLNFLFHIMLPVFKTVMSQNYFQHLSLLVDSVALLNTPSVSLSDLEKADVMLCKFVEDFAQLYKLRHMTINLHLTRHLATTVRNLGPLWATSCFPFEDFNGKLINLSHGTSDSLIQISKKFPILTGLSTEIRNMNAGPAKEFCEKLIKKWRRYHIKENIFDKTFVVGYFDQSVLYTKELSDLLLVLFQYVPKFHTFPKIYHNKQLFVASSYKRSTRKSNAVKYSTSEGVKYGSILTFVKVENKNYFAYVQSFKVVPFFPTSPERLSYLLKVEDVSGHDFVLLSSLEAVCFYISIEDTNYISNVLNPFERF